MFKAMKFKVNNEEHSERVQKILFDSGYEWKMGGKTVKHLQDSVQMGLCTQKDGKIYFNPDTETNFEEIDVSWLDQQETIEIDGTTYRKNDVMERLKELEPVK